MRINTNISAMNTLRTLGNSSKEFSRSVGRLSSGFRINRAADDAAGLGIANKIRADVRSMRQASRNAEQADSLLQVAEGATQTISQIVDRMKELATQAASDNVDDAGRGRIKTEFNALQTEIDKIADTTKFQGKTLVNGNFGTSVDTSTTASTALASGTGVYSASVNGTAAGNYTISDGTAAGELTLSDGSTTQTLTGISDGKQTVVFDQFGVTLELDANFTVYDGTNAGSAKSKIVNVDAGSNGGSFLVRSSGAYTTDDLVTLSNVDLNAAALGISSSDITLTGNGTGAEWQAALSDLDSAISSINSAFGTIGAAQNRIEYAMQNTDAAVENLAAAESVIRDVDMAAEVTQMTKFQILQQAGTAMLAQANAAPQGVLSLLR
ncbi:MAG: flagellin [Gemmatimonadota bacterium]